ncbi:hypothetical protein CEXT_601261 [Caerostris extrusa]|uniref:Uncharacterized protein n=1 Tax=Caerostris extrusa TaxID=172846 RepID=A0AAV4RTY3_CAEEX|nr:hypothetical protein CEXT_601261 [Caerostris extrusa]
MRTLKFLPFLRSFSKYSHDPPQRCVKLRIFFTTKLSSNHPQKAGKKTLNISHPTLSTGYLNDETYKKPDGNTLSHFDANQFYSRNDFEW